MENRVKRIIDANLNRLAEGLRTAEEYARFILNSPQIHAVLKKLRHKARNVLSHQESIEVLKQRNCIEDPGSKLQESSEGRDIAEDVVYANLNRAEESLRVLEEYSKLFNSDYPEEFKELRFELYTVEKKFSLPLKKLQQSSLYVILTEAFCKIGFEETAKEISENGADIVQLREKHISDRELLERALLVRRITRENGILFVVNDRPDIARLCKADGVHVGQNDLPIEKIKTIFPEGFIGKSTHSIKQAKEAQQEGADYIGVGPVFETSTKSGSSPIGVSVANDMFKSVDIPCFAIGGIDEKTVLSIKKRGVEKTAVCTAVISSKNPANTASNLKKLLVD